MGIREMTAVFTHKLEGTFWLNSSHPSHHKQTSLKNTDRARCRWLMPVILATQEVIRKIEVRNQPRQVICKSLSQKHSKQKRSGGVAQVVEHWPCKYEALS
jgi:hypothetical protein